MMEKTARCLEAGVENLYEASFRYEGLYCAVDILRKQGGGYAIYEVKSASHPAEIYGGSFSSTAGKARRPLTHIRKSPSAVPRRRAAEGDYCALLLPDAHQRVWQLSLRGDFYIMGMLSNS